MRNNLKELKILLVEDNEISLCAHANMLEEISNAPDIAQTGQEALYMVSMNDYDLILMDIGLPDIDGIEVTEKIRASLSENAKKVVIIGLTAFDLEDVEKECLSAGMNKVIRKPVHPTVLERLIRM